jgi:hypothetical protein
LAVGPTLQHSLGHTDDVAHTLRPWALSCGCLVALSCFDDKVPRYLPHRFPPRKAGGAARHTYLHIGVGTGGRGWILSPGCRKDVQGPIGSCPDCQTHVPRLIHTEGAHSWSVTE